MSKERLILPVDYADWLASLKQRIFGARQRALLSANEEQIRLYNDIGRDSVDRQGRQGWGAKVIDRLSSDLREEIPDTRGFSTRNLKYMKQFAQECPEFRIGQQSAAQLPWFHNPIGVAEYQLVRRLPKPLDTNLPSSEELETELSRTLNEGEEP